MEAGIVEGPGIHGSRTACSYFQCGTIVEELIEILKSKYGTITRAWKVALDADESGLLDFREFSSALSSIGYVGNMRTLWFNLDHDNSGTISLKELDERAYYFLEKFRVLAGRGYGGMVNCWHKLLDKDKSGTVSFDEFHEAVVELGYSDEAEEMDLFDYLLTTPGIRYITLQDVKFLQTWEETKQVAEYRKRLPKAWINRDPYLTPSKAGSQMSGTMTANPSMTTLSTVSAGQSGEEDYGNIVAFDEGKQKQAFLDFLVDRFDSLPKAFDAMDANGSGGLSMVEFQSVVSTVLRYCRPSEASRLFLSFNKDPQAMLTWDAIGITRPEWVNHLLAKKTKQLKHQAETRGKDGKGAELGRSPRQLNSCAWHRERLRNVQKRADVAFGMPLPKGWGFPPHFDPRDGRMKLPPLSAR